MPRTSGCLSARHSLAATANMIAIIPRAAWRARQPARMASNPISGRAQGAAGALRLDAVQARGAGSGDAGLRTPVVPTHIEKSKEVS